MQEQSTLMSATISLEIINKKETFALRVWAPKINLPIYSPSHWMSVYTKIWKKMLQGLESPQDHVTKESITCRSEPADSDAGTRIDFPQIAPADNNKGYVRHQDETCWTLQKGKD